MGTCSWKTLVAVGGYDGNMIIFNYSTAEILLTHQFEDSILGISFHPSGQHILLSTLSGVCMCSIREKLDVDWKMDHVPASIVKFSPGGDRFAVVERQSVIQVHDFHSVDYTNVTALRAHSKPIVSIDISAYHDELVSIGMDSIICLWNIRTGLVLKRINLLSPAVLSGCFEWNDRVAYVITGDNLLKKVLLTDEANSLGGAMNIIDTKCDHEDKLLTVLPSGTLICSNNRNFQLKALRFHENDLVTHTLTSIGQVSSVCFQTSRLFVAGDGCLAILGYNKKHVSSHQSTYHPLDGVLLTSRHRLSANDHKIMETKNKIESLKVEHTSRLETLQADAKLASEAVNNAHQHKLEVILAQSSILKEQIDGLGASLKLELESVTQRGTDEMEALENTLEKKLAKEKDNIQDFDNRCVEMKQAFEVEMIQTKEKHARDIEIETNQFHARTLSEANCECGAIIKETDALRLQGKNQLMEIEDIAERDIEMLWLNHHIVMKSSKRSNQLLQNEVRNIIAPLLENS